MRHAERAVAYTAGDADQFHIGIVVGNVNLALLIASR